MSLCSSLLSSPSSLLSSSASSWLSSSSLLMLSSLLLSPSLQCWFDILVQFYTCTDDHSFFWYIQTNQFCTHFYSYNPLSGKLSCVLFVFLFPQSPHPPIEFCIGIFHPISTGWQISIHIVCQSKCPHQADIACFLQCILELRVMKVSPPQW